MMRKGENTTFVTMMVALFTQAEREAWGSLFCKAERAQWINPDLDPAILHR